MTADELRPARGYSWLPFTDGNAAALTHGATSERVVAPLARQLVESTLSDPQTAYLAAPRYSVTVHRWAWEETRCELLTAYVERHAADGMGDAKKMRGAFDELHRAQTRAANLRKELGLTPLAAAKLGKDHAGAAALDAAAELTKLREQHERATRARVIDGE